MAKVAVKNKVASVPFDPNIVTKLKSKKSEVEDPEEVPSTKKKVTVRRKNGEPTVAEMGEQLESERGEKASALAVYHKLIIIERKLDALLVASGAGTAPATSGQNPSGRRKGSSLSEVSDVALKKAPKVATEAETAPHGVELGDFIIEGRDWFKVERKVGDTYHCVHHQTGERKSFTGTPAFVRRTKRKDTPCWEMV